MNVPVSRTITKTKICKPQESFWCQGQKVKIVTILSKEQYMDTRVIPVR